MIVHNVNMIEVVEPFEYIKDEKKAVANCMRMLATAVDDIECDSCWVTQGIVINVNFNPEMVVHGQVFFD